MAGEMVSGRVLLGELLNLHRPGLQSAVRQKTEIDSNRHPSRRSADGLKTSSRTGLRDDVAEDGSPPQRAAIGYRHSNVPRTTEINECFVLDTDGADVINSSGTLARANDTGPGRGLRREGSGASERQHKASERGGLGVGLFARQSGVETMYLAPTAVLCRDSRRRGTAGRRRVPKRLGYYGALCLARRIQPR